MTMSRPLEPGQAAYRSCRVTPLGPARIHTTEYDPGSASARFVDPDTGATGVVLIDDLHDSATTRDRTARRNGYVLDQKGEGK